MTTAWADLKIPDDDFNVAALHSALDAVRMARGMTWKAVAHEVNRADERYLIRPISASTISGLKNKRRGVEGHGVLQMLLWLDRTRESFVPAHPGANHPDAQLPRVSGSQMLRFDVPEIYSKLDALRNARNLTSGEVASQIGGLYIGETLKNMRQQNSNCIPAGDAAWPMATLSRRSADTGHG